MRGKLLPSRDIHPLNSKATAPSRHLLGPGHGPCYIELGNEGLVT